MNVDFSHARLTPRERQILAELAKDGASNKEIGARLGVTEGTMKVYMCRLIQKVGASNRTDLAVWAARSVEGERP